MKRKDTLGKILSNELVKVFVQGLVETMKPKKKTLWEKIEAFFRGWFEYELRAYNEKQITKEVYKLKIRKAALKRIRE